METHRQYLRMNTVFPVELRVSSQDGQSLSTRLLQGFTRDVSSGGMCIELKSFGKNTEKLIAFDTVLELTINPTFSIRPVRAKGRIAWVKKQDDPLPSRYFLGVAYTEIDPAASQRILRFARRAIWVPRLSAVAGILLIAALALTSVNHQGLVIENRRLVRELVDIARNKSAVAENLVRIQRKKKSLDAELERAAKKIRDSESHAATLAAQNVSQRAAYEADRTALLGRQKQIQAEIEKLKTGQDKLQNTYQKLERQTPMATAQGLSQMGGWLMAHQNRITGLVASFEGDAALEDWAFTYDQALACQAFLLLGENSRADQILRFFAARAKRFESTGPGLFFNAYHAVDGYPMENTVHVGPNIWVGIAALQYEHRVRSGAYRDLARSIGDEVIAAQDEEGGLKGGPAFSWYSTEHNLDAYAFLGMLYQVTQDARYQAAQGRSLEWIRRYAYSVREGRMNRGKGDATISTDTFSWAIAALGPAVLSRLAFNPEDIIAFAEKHCGVTVEARGMKVRGFDFAKAQHVGRGGVISTEWTAQMIVAYRLLSDYFEAFGDPDKARRYADKAVFYLNELQKLMVTSPSRMGQGRGCLPYASMDNVDTGHGWRTPKGLSTGSVAGTAYGIFAWVGSNPFQLPAQLVRTPESFVQP